MRSAPTEQAFDVSNRPPLGASVRGPSAWLVWQTTRDALLRRLRQLEADPNVDPRVVRGFRNTIEVLEQAAGEFRAWDAVRNAADSVEAPMGGRGGGLRNPSQRWVETSEVAASLNCSNRWVTQLIQQGRLVASKRGRAWLIEFQRGVTRSCC